MKKLARFGSSDKLGQSPLLALGRWAKETAKRSLVLFPEGTFDSFIWWGKIGHREGTV